MDRNALRAICEDYLYILGELSEGRTWKDENALQAAGATVYISAQKILSLNNSPSEKRGSWDKCDCGNREINFKNQKTGEPYQKCIKCNLYLNADHTVKPIPPKKEF